MGWSGAVLEAPGLVSGLDDLAVMRQAIEQRSGHLRVAEDGGPISERQVCGDDDRGAFVKPAEQVEEQLSASLGEGEIVLRRRGRDGSSHRDQQARCP